MLVDFEEFALNTRYFIIGLIIGQVLMRLIHLLCLWIKFYIQIKYTSEETTAVHEAGHFLAWLKYCPCKNSKYVYTKHYEKIESLRIDPLTRNGIFQVRTNFKRNNNNKKIAKHTLLGGIAATMFYYNQKPTTLNIWFHKHFLGCFGDLDYIKCLNKYSNKQIKNLLTEQISQMDEYDRLFIDDFSKQLMKMKPDEQGLKSIQRDKLFEYAQMYKNRKINADASSVAY